MYDEIEAVELQFDIKIETVADNDTASASGPIAIYGIVKDGKPIDAYVIKAPRQLGEAYRPCIGPWVGLAPKKLLYKANSVDENYLSGRIVKSVRVAVYTAMQMLEARDEANRKNS